MIFFSEKSNSETKKRIKRLREEIARLRYAYHVENTPDVTDNIYDSLTRELNSLLARYPEFADMNALENRVAGRPLDKFEKVKHEIKMLSIGNVFLEEEFFAWEKRNLKLLPSRTKLEYFCELKFDGLAVSLIYENGKFIRGVTRGDGEIGENITSNLKMIESIPLMLESPYPKRIEVRGEAVMFKETLSRLNLDNKKKDKPLFANSRNAAAGSLRQLDPKLVKERHLDFFAYEIAQMTGAGWKKYMEKHSGKHELLKKFGFIIDKYSKRFTSSKEIPNFVNEVSKIREGLPFNIDGIVINIDDTETFEKLGVAGKDPRGTVAFKYPAERVTTVVKGIKINVGRTGVLTPLALFEPTAIAGSVVSKATLHNADQIERLDLRIGDTIVIEKAGDVIPKVIEVLVRMRAGGEKKFRMVQRCPACGSKVEKRKLEATLSTAHYCSNSKCPAKNGRYLEHFVSVFGIYELGPKILRRFKDEGLITDAADIFTLTEEDIASLERFGEKSAENIMKEIKNKKKIPFFKFIWALGILHVGEETARDLAVNFGNLQNLVKADIDDLNKIENIGPTVSKSVYNFFHSENGQNNLNFIKKLEKNGVIIEKAGKNKNTRLNGLTFVLTGTLESMSRTLAKEKIISLGGKVASSVSKNTSYIIAGSDSGSKLKNAEKLGIKMIDEKKFLELL